MLRQMLVDLTRQLDSAHGRLEKTQRLLQQLLMARSGSRSEQLSADQLRLFAQELGLGAATEPEQEPAPGKDRDDEPPGASDSPYRKPRGRHSLPRHLKRERRVHDLAEVEKHCTGCDQDLRHIGEEVSERYEYIPAQMLVVEEVCHKYGASRLFETGWR